MENRKLFEDVFKEVNIDEVDGFMGGKWTAAQCVAAALACAASAAGCGSVDATLCDAVMKNCS